jgi:glycosyltransferase involved in cell wall biosynthesis
LPNKILGIICTSPGWGGLELNTLRLARWLREAGWKVHLLSRADSPLLRNAGDAFNSVAEFNGPGLPGKAGRLRATNAWVKQHHIHLLFIPFNKDINAASLYKRFYDGDIGLVYQQHMQVGVRKRDFIHTLRYAMIDIWISPLQYLKEETMRLTRVKEDNIEVVPIGLDTRPILASQWTREQARAALGLPSDAYVIGVLGRLDPKKGQDTVVRGLAELRQKSNQNYQVLFMGDATIDEGDEYKTKLRRLVRDSGLDRAVHFRPFTEDIMQFFRAIDVFAMPSHGETYGMVTLEAMAAGVPVVGTNKDGTRELLGEGKYGYLFEKEDTEGFCKQIEKLQQDPELSHKLKAAREVVLKEFSHEKMVGRINELLMELVPG